MTVRVVVSVVLALALVAVATPAIDDAATARSEAVAAGEAAELVEEIETLAAEENAVETGPPARRFVELRVPEPGTTTEAVRFTIRPGAANGTEFATVRYAVGAGRPDSIRPDVAIRTPDGPLRIAEPTVHRLRLELITGDEQPIVRIVPDV